MENNLKSWFVSNFFLKTTCYKFPLVLDTVQSFIRGSLASRPPKLLQSSYPSGYSHFCLCYRTQRHLRFKMVIVTKTGLTLLLLRYTRWDCLSSSLLSLSWLSLSPISWLQRSCDSKLLGLKEIVRHVVLTKWLGAPKEVFNPCIRLPLVTCSPHLTLQLYGFQVSQKNTMILLSKNMFSRSPRIKRKRGG